MDLKSFCLDQLDRYPALETQDMVKALYQREHAQAMEHALNEAVQHFNVCPLCHGLVCNYCFIICDDSCCRYDCNLYRDYLRKKKM